MNLTKLQKLILEFYEQNYFLEIEKFRNQNGFARSSVNNALTDLERRKLVIKQKDTNEKGRPKVYWIKRRKK